MNRIEQIFKTRPAFIGFLTGGDGGVDYTIDCALAMLEGGVDILEIGFPFSDPIADGPVIQQASKRSLDQGTTSQTMLEIARGIRKKSDAPLVLFSYFNPLLKKGEKFLKEVNSAGFDAILAVDLPPPIDGMEKHPYYLQLTEAKLHPILLASPSTDPERLVRIKEKAEGFLYYACQKGTTGVRKALPDDFAYNLSRLRQQINIPVAAGFGIADRETALQAIEHANGFVVGSAFVKLMAQKADPNALKKLAMAIDPRDFSPQRAQTRL
jgi:tryptophan synthase alpha chain